MNSTNNHPDFTEQNPAAAGEFTPTSDTQAAEPVAEVVATVEQDTIPSPVAVADTLTQPVESVQPVEAAPVDAAPSGDQLAETVWTGVPAPGAEVVVAKKKHTRLVAILAIVAVVLCALGGVGYWFYPKIKMAVLGPTAYYLDAERSAVLGLFREIDKLQQVGDFSMNGQLNCEVVDGEVPDEARTALSKASIKFSQSYSQKDKAASLLFGLLYEDKDILSVLEEMKDGKIAVSLPGLAEGKYLLENAINADASLKDITGMEEKELFLYIWSYYETVVDSIPSDNIKTESGEFKHLSCTTTTMHIDKQAAEQICKNLASKIKADQKLVPLLTKVLDFAKSTQDESLNAMITWPDQEEIEEGIQELVAELEKAEAPEDWEMDFIVYYNGRGKIMARELRGVDEDDVEGSFVLASYTAGAKDIQELEFTAGDSGLAIRHSQPKLNGAYKGELTVDVKDEGQEIQPVKVTYNLHPETVGGVKTYLGQFKMEVLIEGTGFVLDGNSVKKDNKVDTQATLTVKYKEMVSIGLKFTGAIEVSNKANLNIDIPEQSTMNPDAEEILKALCENIDKTGLMEDLFPGFDMTAQDLLWILQMQMGDVYYLEDEWDDYPYDEEYFDEDFFGDDFETGYM